MHHSFVVLWRIEGGRWYVMRDRPTWFLHECMLSGHGDTPSETIDHLADLAADELRNRYRRAFQKITYEHFKAEVEAANKDDGNGLR